MKAAAMKELLTPKQVARAVGASEASLKRWCDKGLLPATRTAGGHRRLPLSGVLQFLRDRGQPLVRPEVLGLPSSSGKGELTVERASESMRAALEAGDDEQLLRLAFDLYLGGRSACEVLDGALAPALHAVGQRWEHGETEVYEERRGVQATLAVLYQLVRVLPARPEGAPLAIGGTLPGDPYSIPTLMVEICLREAGWDAHSFGTELPADTLRAALEQVRPGLFWLSVSSLRSEAEFLASYARIQEKARDLDVPVVVGGRALTDAVRRQMEYAAYCDTLRHLEAFARTLLPKKSKADQDQEKHA
jgi:excisionase family DNA binding protein